MDGEKNLEWLPVDWKVKKRKRCGRKKTWYVEPKNGLKFSTKSQVLRYLNEDGVDSQQPQQQREEKQDKVSNGRTVAENLPEGWTKETQRRRNSRKKDTVYIEPVTEQEFRSMASVLRHLKAKDEEKDRIGTKDDHSQSSTTEAEEKILIENKGDEGFAEEIFAESEPSPGNNGAETSSQPNGLLDISVEDYQIESCMDFLVDAPKKDIQLDKSGETPAVGSSSKLPPDDFFNIPWFLPAYKLIIDEIPLETYVQQTSTGCSVPGQG